MAVAAVITADIVNSTQLTKAQEKKLFQQLNEVLSPYQSEFYRGDSFQVYLKDPADALQLVLNLRMKARQAAMEFDIRAAVGLGEVVTPLRKLGVAGGEAFVLSGRSMDELGKSDERRLIIRSAAESGNDLLDVIALFADYLCREMTSKQARVISMLLEGATQVGVAKEIRKSQSTVNKHVQSAGWSELSKLLSTYRQLFK